MWPLERLARRGLRNWELKLLSLCLGILVVVGHRLGWWT